MKAHTKTLLEEAVKRASWDPAYFCRFFLPAWFPSQMPPFHLGLLALVTRKVEFLDEYEYAHDFLLNHFKYQPDPRINAADGEPAPAPEPAFLLGEDGKLRLVAGEHNNVIVPRGFSKTTLLNAANLYELLTDGTIFTVYISKSSEHAETQLGNIKIEIETNVLLREAYGNLVPSRADAEKWQSDQIQLTNGGILIARGRGGQVRGLNYRARRPNRIILDDVEDDDKAMSTTERTKTESWFYSAVEKAGQVMDGAVGEDWAQQPLQITNLGTLLGAECLMMTLAKDPKFNTVKFGAKLNLEDPNDTEMLWAYKMSYATYERERTRHAGIGKLGEFSRELDSSLRVADDSVFPSVFIYAPTPLSDLVFRALALDPAISKARKADSAALVVGGRRATDGALWFLDEWGGQGKTPRELIDAVFDYRARWQTNIHGIESVAFQEALLYIMQEEMARRQDYFVVEGIKHGQQEKIARIEGILSPRYKLGVIRHLRPLPNLEGNLADWPNGKKDFADAAAMALKLLGERESQMLAVPKDARNTGDYAPLDAPIPSAYLAVGNYVTRSTPLANGRYG